MAARNASHLYTITAIKRWSCESKRIPGVDHVKAIHVYDFDNTLFATPLPNELIWTKSAIGHLTQSDYFMNGGWWHDPGILAATGEGVDIEEQRGYAGWWNENIVKTSRQSIASEDTLTILLTGRSEAKFQELISRILRSKGLNFDLICLKPTVTPTNVQVTSTMHYKSELLKSLVYTYKRAQTIRIWEDRPNHVKRFRNLFAEVNTDIQQGRTPVQRDRIHAVVIPVYGLVTSLKELTEVCQIQSIVNQHNKAIARGTAPAAFEPLTIRSSVAYSAYVVMSDYDCALLRNLVKLPSSLKNAATTWPPTLLIQQGAIAGPLRSYIGEVGTTIKLRVTSYASWNNQMWAVRVEALPGTYGFQSSLHPPVMLLASTRPNGINDTAKIEEQRWTDIPTTNRFDVEATIVERLMLDIGPEVLPPITAEEPPRKKQRQNGPSNSNRLENAPMEDIHQADFISLDAGQETAASTYGRNPNDYRPPQSISANTGASRGRGGRNGFRDGGSGRSNDRRADERRNRGNIRGGARGRGRGATYRSLDDVNDRPYRANTGAGYRDYDAPGGANGQRDIDY